MSEGTDPPYSMASEQQQVLQVVSGDGEFNETGVRDFVSEAHIDTAGTNYQTIAITGPQSSGKSTLMNALVRARLAKSAVPAQSHGFHRIMLLY